MYQNGNTGKGLSDTACEALKRAREAKGLSQVDIAARAQLSPSYISQLESGNRVPSLAVLFEKIAPSYGISNIFEIIERGNITHKQVVVVQSNIKELGVLSFPDDKLEYRVEADQRLYDERVSIGYAILEPGADSGKSSHIGEEAFVVLEGEVKLEIDGEEHALKPFNFVHYKATKTHRVHNDGVNRALVLVIRFPAH